MNKDSNPDIGGRAFHRQYGSPKAPMAPLERYSPLTEAFYQTRLAAQNAFRPPVPVERAVAEDDLPVVYCTGLGWMPRQK